MKVKHAIGGLCAAVILSSGCATSLKGKKIKSMQAQLSDSKALCPGQEWGLIARLEVEGEEETLVTEGYGNGDLPWAGNLRVRLSDGKDRGNGGITMPTDPRRIYGRPVIATVSAVHDANFSQDVPIQARFDCAYNADFSGEDGKDGKPGAPGFAGQQNRNGKSGKNGKHGKDGENGHDLDVKVTLLEGPDLPTKYLQVAVTSRQSQETRHYLVDVNGGKISIESNGGDGGRGGNGGKGGAAGKPNPKNPQRTYSGNGGHGGNGGNGKNGGNITIYIDPKAEPYRELITLKNSGGHAGAAGIGQEGGAGGYERPDVGQDGEEGVEGEPGPEPEFIVGLVSPLWNLTTDTEVTEGALSGSPGGN